MQKKAKHNRSSGWVRTAMTMAVAPDSDEGRPQIKEQLVKLDLMLHHLVAMLERIVERAGFGVHASSRERKGTGNAGGASPVGRWLHCWSHQANGSD